MEVARLDRARSGDKLEVSDSKRRKIFEEAMKQEMLE
jgi:hypothetical protein